MLHLFELDKTLFFDFETFLREEDDKERSKDSDRDICKFYLKGRCRHGDRCPYRHDRREEKTKVVCKHWLRGLCKKGDDCEFLHEDDPTKMPECWFFTNYGECTNPECIFLHILPEDKMKPCQWYDRGFCKHGIESCKKKHTPKVACPDYMAGFCSQGPACKFAHPKFELPWEDDRLKERKHRGGISAPPQGAEQEILVEDVTYQQQPQQQYSSYSQQRQFYGSSNQMNFNPAQPVQQQQQMYPQQQQQQFINPQQQQTMDYSQLQQMQQMQQQQQGYGMMQHQQNPPQQKRALSEVLCFKCQQYGHYANNCTNPKKF